MKIVQGMTFQTHKAGAVHFSYLLSRKLYEYIIHIANNILSNNRPMKQRKKTKTLTNIDHEHCIQSNPKLKSIGQEEF